MKRSIFLIACILCHIGIQAQISHTVVFEPDKLIIDNQLQEDGNRYSNLLYEDCSVNDSVGAPSLPYRILRFIVPNDPVSFSIDINSSNSTQIDLPAPLLPIQAPVPTSLNSAKSEFIPSSFVTSGAYPEKIVQIINEGYLDGDKRILTVKVTPVQYLAASNCLLFHSSVGFTINSNPDNLSSRSSERRISPIAAPSRESTELVKMLGFVENKSDISRILNSRSQVHATASTMNLPAYEYVVITSQSLAPYFKRLVDWKRQKGLNAGIVTMQDILSDASITKDEASNLSDDAGKLRQYLKLAYGKGTRYVLLGGGNEFVPIRYGTGYENKWEVLNGGVIEFEGAKIPSDLYFSDLNGNWNKDGDIYLGEELGDAVDYEPELYVGRLLCKNGFEINNYIDKLLLYEQNPGKGDVAYLKKAFYTQADQMQESHQAEKIANDFKNIFPTFSLIQELPNGKDSFPTFPTGKSVINAMNNEYYGFLSWYGHGGPNAIIVRSNQLVKGGHCCSIIATEGEYLNPSIVIEQGNGINNMDNLNYPSIAYTIACTVAPYDTFRTSYINYNVKYNLGEALTIAGKYGCVAFLGNSRSGWVSGSHELEINFVDKIKNNFVKIGIAEALSKAENKESMFHWLALTHNLIGCPEFEIWTDIPSKFQNVTVTESFDGVKINTGIENVNIALRGLFSDNNVLFRVGQTTTFTNLPKNYVLTFYKHNYFPYVFPIYLQNESVVGSHYIKGSKIFTGNSVNNYKGSGDFKVKSGSNLVLEVSDGVTLDAGTEIELGAEFEIKLNN